MSRHHPNGTRAHGPPHGADPANSPGTSTVGRSSEIPLSIVVPVFGSENTLRELCQRIASAVSPLASTFEIVLVDDASTDSSWRVIQEICAGDDRIVGVHLSTNLGQHRATLRGLSLARGRTVVTLDDDLQQYPEDIPLLCRALEDRGLGAAIGSFAARHHSWQRKFGSAVVQRIAKRVHGIPQSLQLTSFRAMRAEVVDEVLRLQGPNSTIGPLVLRATRAVINVDVRHAPRVSGSSGFTISKLLDFFFSMVFDARPRAYLAAKWLGLFLVLIGIALDLPSFESSRFTFWASAALRVLVICGGLLLVSLEAIRKRVAPVNLGSRSEITMEILRGNERLVVDARLLAEDG
jgi:glycosyltransferase involved in cell wall biosynthesis